MTLYAAVFKRSMLPCPEMPPAMFEGVWLSSRMRGIPNDRLWVELPVVQSQRLANGGDNIWVTPPIVPLTEEIQITARVDRG